MKWGIGTVQFGMPYGVANTQSPCSIEEAGKILQEAANHNISFLDTAPVYGNSEFVLGKICPKNNPFNLTTKIPSLQNVFSSLQCSLKNLQVKSVYGLLIHQVNDLFSENGEQIWDAMLELKSLGLVKKIGASVYSSEQIEKLISLYKIDIIQLPISIFDQRLLHKGCLTVLNKMNIEIHARSVFLQGLLLMPFNDIPDFFAPIKPDLERYDQWVVNNKMTRLQAALHFIENIKEIDVAILGINSLQQLREILSYSPAYYNIEEFLPFAIHNETMLNPSCWKLQ